MELGRNYDPRELKLDAYDLELKRKRDLELELEQRLKREQGPKLELKRSNRMELELKQEIDLYNLESISLSDFMGRNNYSLSSNGMTYGEESNVGNSERNSRCVSVDTISPAPEGRRSKKEMFKGKSQLVKFRCTSYEKKLLKAKANRCNLTLSEYLRKSAMEQAVAERFADDEIEVYKMLVKYHNNFKSIGNMFRGKNEGLTKMVYEVAKEIKEHLKKFK
ncbi:mobilization protein MbpA [uncultured Zobellia sp.]|uniref:mobilization protein MbpA n=1 Tax=uncultured Zobellia sp. TaxID=255433 RepID=UPI002599141F|nr:mobilization protein MbpA [uncultured Zobellia sp.]